MYKIIGADQKTYGPVSADVIREWIASRRANASTRVQVDGSAEWKPLNEFFEFKDALTAVPPVPPLPSQAATSQARTPPLPTSGLAIASLVCGIFGCLGITAVVGVILGAISLIKINRSGGRLGGQSVAIAGICVSALMIPVVSVLAGLMLPALAKAKNRAQTIQCVGNLKQLALAARMYADQNNDKFPNAANWCDLLQSRATSVRIFQCPSSGGTLCGYGYNAAVSGRSIEDVNPSTVLFFEIPGGWNVSGGPEQLIQTARHGAVINVAFADGSVRQISMKDKLGTSWLRWEP